MPSPEPVGNLGQEWFDSLVEAAHRVGTPPPVAAPRSVDVLAAGTRLHVLDWAGDGRGTVVLAHGIGLTAHTWNLVAAGLVADGWRVVAPDLRGHGDSEWSPGMHYSVDDHADDLQALVSLLEPRPRAICGFSLGGLATIRLAGRGADFAALVVVDTSPAALESRRDRRLARRNTLTEFLATPPLLDSPEDFVAQALALNPAREASVLRVTLRQSLRQVADGRWTWKFDPRPFAGAAGASHGYPSAADLWADVARIEAPTLVLRGEISDFLTSHDAERFVAALPDGRLGVVPGAGHAGHSDNPKAFLELVRAHLATVGTRR